MLSNQHALFVKFHGETTHKPARISITSKRFKSRVIFSYDYDFNNTLENAESWLRSRGFNLTGMFENGDAGYVILSDSFVDPREAVAPRASKMILIGTNI